MSMMSGAGLGMRSAAGQIRPTAGRARGMAEIRILNARGWTAPHFHRAARFVDTSMAPRISGMLTDTARRIEPAPPRHRGRTMALGALGIVVVAAAVGTATARRRSQMAELLEPEDSVSYEERAQSDPAYAGEQGHSGIGGGSESERFGSGSWVGRGSGPGHNRGVGRS
jgi:hypothetical protein